MKEKFIQFLKDNYVYNRFKAYRQTASEDEKACLSLCFDYVPENWICLAFRWDNTDEGFDFWDKLSSKWKKSIMPKKVTIQIKSCNKGNTEISLDVITALERMGYVASLIEIQ